MVTVKQVRAFISFWRERENSRGTEDEDESDVASAKRLKSFFSKPKKRRVRAGTRKQGRKTVPKYKVITEQKYDATTAQEAESIARELLREKEGTLLDKLTNISDDDIRKVLAPKLTVNLSSSFQGLAMW